MKKACGIFLAATVMTFCASLPIASAAPVDPVCEKVLAAAEVSKVYGKKPVKLFGNGETHWANSTCNYGRADDQKPVLTVTINPAVSDQLYNNVYKKNQVYTANRQAIKGVGDEAFSAGAQNNIVMAKKGKLFVLLVSSSEVDKKTFKTAPMFSTDQLVAWMKQILERYK